MADVKDLGDGKDAHQLIEEVFVGEDRSTCNKLYNKRAPNYEKDMAAINHFGLTRLIRNISTSLTSPKRAKSWKSVLALVRELAKREYTNLHAIDGTEAMLAKAKEEGSYKSYTHFLFNTDSKLPFSNREFDCAWLAGVFAPGPLPIVALHEMCRVIKKGDGVAFICCEPSDYEDKDKQYANRGFYKIVEGLGDERRWKERDGFPASVPYLSTVMVL